MAARDGYNFMVTPSIRAGNLTFTLIVILRTGNTNRPFSDNVDQEFTPPIK